MEWDNYRKIECFGGPLAAKYTSDDPFQTTSKLDFIHLIQERKQQAEFR
jgi:hypothetical protein